jgi:HAMP domain-containing protein
METRTAQSAGGQTGPSLVDLIERNPMLPQRRSPLEWWYQMMAPPEPLATANLKQREAHRRGRLIATILFLQILLDIFVVLTVGVFVNHFVILNTGLFIPVLLFAGWLNRRGRVIISGIFSVAFLEISLFALILTYPGGLTTFALPFFDLLVFGALFAVSLLPEGTVFLVAALNIGFIVGALFLMPKSNELAALLQTSNAGDAIVRPVAIQIGVAFVSYLWVRSAKKALERADRATSIATLEHSLAQQGQQIEQEKQQLEQSIQQIVETHMRVARGDVSARVPLSPDSALWQVSGLLNNTLARLEHLQRAETELQQVRRIVDYLGEALRRPTGKPIAWSQTGTVFDTFVAQYNTLAQHYEGLVREHETLSRAYSERQRWQTS